MAIYKPGERHFSIPTKFEDKGFLAAAKTQALLHFDASTKTDLLLTDQKVQVIYKGTHKLNFTYVLGILLRDMDQKFGVISSQGNNVPADFGHQYDPDRPLSVKAKKVSLPLSILDNLTVSELSKGYRIQLYGYDVSVHRLEATSTYEVNWHGLGGIGIGPLSEDRSMIMVISELYDLVAKSILFLDLRRE